MAYDKAEVKDQLTTDMIFDIVNNLGGEPRLTNFGFIASTICHNHIGEGSHKLYYYENTRLFHCYTGCYDTFDIFELVTKIKKREDKSWDLNNSIYWVASYCGISESQYQPAQVLSHLKLLEKYDKIKVSNVIPVETLTLPEYDAVILDRFVYPHIYDWEKEGIMKEVIDYNRIGYYPGGEQITIPHYDINGRFIGLRGRALGSDEAEMYGKYRPLYVHGVIYSHPLALNLYNINNSKNGISTLQKAIIFEGEKSCLLYQSYFGHELDISTACCGSSISSHQIKQLIDLGAKEIIVGFDKQFQERDDDEYKHLIKNLTNIHAKYNPYVNISFLFDKGNLLGYKDSPIDKGKETFLELYKNRVII